MMIETFEYKSLEQFGVKILTGEACGLGMRLLCDLNQDGVELWKLFTRSTTTQDNWNNGAVASVMMPRSMLQELWVFAHVQAETPYVWLGGYVRVNEWRETNGYKHPIKSWQPNAYVITNNEYTKQYWDEINWLVDKKQYYISRIYKKSEQPGTGVDNTHMISGRTY